MSYHGGSSARTSSTNRTSTNRTSTNRQVVVTPPVVPQLVAPPGYHYMPDGSLMPDSQMQGNVVDQEPQAVVSQRKEAPPGFHYMANGLLMSDAKHNELYGTKVISDFTFDYANIPEGGGTKLYQVKGQKGASFYLEIKNRHGKYYNFKTNTFTTIKADLYQQTIGSSKIKSGSIVFPTVSSDDQYDIYLHANPGTEHVPLIEYRYADGSIDFNFSKGSNGLLLQKVLYQYTDVTLTITGFSVDSTTPTGTITSDTLTLSRGYSLKNYNFSFTIPISATTKCFQIKKQPQPSDVIGFVSVTVPSAPVFIEGENIYPAVNNTDIVDGTGFAAATVNKFVMNTNVADKMVVGDKITIATTDLTDTVDGAVTSGIKVVMDNNVATKMAVGDRITNSGAPQAFLSQNTVTVAALNPDGDNAKEFSMSEAVGLADGLALVFTPKCNRELFTVAALNPDEDNAKEFSYVDAAGGTGSRLGVMDNAVLSFSNQKNRGWSVSNAVNISDGSTVILSPGTTTLTSYTDDLITLKDTFYESEINLKRLPAIVKTQKPTVVKGVETVQLANIYLKDAQPLTFAGAVKIGGYGTGGIYNSSGYKLNFSNLKIELSAITTTTTSSTVGAPSTTVAVASRNGILDDVSVVSGIGIDPKVVDPTVDSGAGAVSGAGNIVLTAAQELESGISLTFGNAGQTATITGSVEVLEAGPADFSIRFDIDKLLSVT